MNGKIGEAVKSTVLKAKQGATQLWASRYGLRAKDMVNKYEQFTGVAEIMRLQNVVLQAQEKFISAQDRRREKSNNLIALQWRLKEIHDEMQTTPKGEEKYLKLVTEEHKLIIEEQHLRKEFHAAEREEREHFNAMSSAVKMSHEQERAHTYRSKYWYVVASLVGTALGIGGTTLNNRLKMTEFKEMIVSQLQTNNGSQMGGGSGSNIQLQDIENAVRKELKDVEMRIAALSQNQETIFQTIRQSDKNREMRFSELKALIIKTKSPNAVIKEKNVVVEIEPNVNKSEPYISDTLQNLEDRVQNAGTKELLLLSGTAGLVVLIFAFFMGR